MIQNTEIQEKKTQRIQNTEIQEKLNADEHKIKRKQTQKQHKIQI